MSLEEDKIIKFSDIKEDNDKKDDNVKEFDINDFDFEEMGDFFEKYEKEDESNDLLFKAYETTDIAEKIRLAKKAIKIYPDNIDAINLVTEQEEDLDKRLAKIKKTIKKAEDILNEDNMFDKEYIGIFWGLMETRPYMRTRHIYILTLIELKRYEEAMKECEELLELCESDNLGIRYLLIGIYTGLEEYKKVEKLYKKYPNKRPFMLIPIVYVTYKLGKYDVAKKHLLNADNEFVIPYLKGEIKISKTRERIIKDKKEIRMFSADEVYLAIEELKKHVAIDEDFFKWVKNTF